MRLAMLRLALALPLLAILAACAGGPGQVAPVQAASAHLPQLLPPDLAAQNFIAVARRMEPLIEAGCRARAAAAQNCDYRVVVDDRPGQAPNAFQTFESSGRPVIGFNLALISEARNQDELAFVMAHEAAHHIAGHIPRKQQDAMAGALIFGTLAAASGADPTAIRSAQDFGATVGSRAKSKDYELEADRLGTVLTWNAGYDPLLGAAFFTRIPDPGRMILGTHPANALRMDVVRQTVAELRARGR
ncbi:M48 family metallopeptidase [Pontitalea aquivivens]|uniref:M48 family metallopeptidase n=1 Tax=Pontitalea aquivivens TaxID=3388663 RepID=UPI003970CFBD